MTSSHTIAPPAPGRLQQRATRIIFFIAGFGTAAWAPIVPFAKARAGLDEGMLGLLLLCLGVGSIVAMPLAGALAGRVGCRRVLVASTGLMCLTLPLLALGAGLPVLVPALLAFGAAVGSMDCAMNIQAVIVERASGRPMMSGFHALYSVGGIAGAAGVSVLFAAGVPPVLAILCVVAGIGAALLASAAQFLPYGTGRDGPAFAAPHGIVLLLGALCFIAFLTEGSVLDWSGVVLTAVHGMAPSRAGLGYAAFALTMTIGRLSGDAIVRRAGGIRVIAVGGVCAAGGLALATLAPSWGVGLLGYALVGAGCSNIVPVLYTATGRQAAMPEHTAVAAVTTLGYAGILAGPAAIGFLAAATSLPAAFLAVAALLLGLAAAAALPALRRLVL